MSKLFLPLFLFLNLVSFSQQDRGCGGAYSIQITTYSNSSSYYHELTDGYGDRYVDTVVITLKDLDTIQILWNWIAYMEHFDNNFIPVWTKNNIALDSSDGYIYDLFSCLSTGSSCSADCAKTKIITSDTGLYVFQNSPSFRIPVIKVQKEKDTIMPIKTLDKTISFLILYPNPSISVVKAKFINDLESTIYIDIYDLNGKLTKQIASSNSEVLINVSDLKLGMYFFKYYTKEEDLGSSKFIKKSY